jgi:hypothetical protein
MTIRSLAVVVAVALSAADCHVYVPEPYAYQPAPPPPRPPVARPVAPAPPPPPPMPPQPSPPEPPRRVARRTVAPPTVSVETTSVYSASTPPPSTAIPAPPATPSTASAPVACLDTGVAPVGDCGAIKLPDASCEHFSAARQKCDAYKTYFDAKVAALAVSCVTSLTSRQVCDASQPLICAKTALAQACPDPSVVQLCQIAATSCKITPGECSALLSGLNDVGQQAIAQCVAQGCPMGLGGCIDGLAKSAAHSL